MADLPATGMVARVRRHPWDRTALGPMRLWDPVIRATVDLLLGSPVAMALAYGEDLVLIHGDYCFPCQERWYMS